MAGIAKAVELIEVDAASLISELKERAYVRSWKAGRTRFYKLTQFEIAEVEKKTESWTGGELSTSRIGFDFRKKVVNIIAHG